jgi:hypothetical protein
VDTGQSWQGAPVSPQQILQAAQHIDRPVIAINVLKDLAADGPELTALSTALQRYSWLGERRPAVVATKGAKTYDDALALYPAVTIQARPKGLGHVWEWAGPDGVVKFSTAKMTAELFDEADFKEADLLPVTPHGHQLPSVLAGLLGQNTWPDGEKYLRQHVDALIKPNVGVALGQLRQREPDDSRIGAYEVILRLVRDAGGVAPESAPRLKLAIPKQHSEPTPEFSLSGPLRETFAFDYLVPKEDRRSRKPWNDLLLWLMYSDKLSLAEAVALAKGVHEVAARTVALNGGHGRSAKPEEMIDHGPANATVFAAIADVLGIDSATAKGLAAPNTDAVAASHVLQAAVNQVQGCRLDPIDRLIWVMRIGELARLWEANTNPHHRRIAGLLTFLSHEMATC